jgi:hypothetical protein
MAELKLFDIPGAFNSGYDRGRQMRQANTLNQLAAQAYGAPVEQRDALVRQAIASDAASGLQLGQALDQDDARRTRSLVNMARMLTNAPDQARPQLYQRMLPSLQRFGVEAPPQYDDTVAQTAQAIVQAYGLADGSTPTEVRAFQAMTQGLTPDEQERARRIHLGLEGRASNAGMGFGTFKDAQGFERPQRSNPRTGQVEIWYDEQGRWVPLGEAAAAVPAGYPMAPAAPTVFTGADGTPVTIDPSIPPNVAADIMRNEAQWAAAPDMATAHLPEQRVPQFSGTPAGLGRGRRPEDEAAARRAAETAVELAALPQRQAIETQGAIERTRGTEQAKADAEQAAGAPKRIAKYRQALAAASNVETSIGKALQMAGPMSTGFVGARLRKVEGTPAYNLASEIETIKANLGFDRLQQMRDNSPTGGALGAIAVQELVALQSTVANLDPNQSEEQLRENLGRIREHYDSWRSVVEQALQEEQQRQPAPSNGPSDGPGKQFQNTAPVVDWPRPGDVQDGYRFRGGNPADPSAWERL